MVVPSESKLVINGTSSIHDWSMEAVDFSCQLVFNINDAEVGQITNVQFSLAVDDIISDSNLMDRKAHDALKEEQSPYITFTQDVLKSFSTEKGQISGEISGYLSVAGETKEVVVPFTGKLLDNNRITVTGNLSLKMSAFNIEPPTAMLGVLKTDDAVALDYSFEFQPDLTSKR